MLQIPLKEVKSQRCKKKLSSMQIEPSSMEIQRISRKSFFHQNIKKSNLKKLKQTQIDLSSSEQHLR